MKIMIASDLHGSFYYGQKLFERFEEEKAEELMLLGDLLYHGARNALPEEYSTINLTKLLNQYKDRILAVRGNCDAEIDQTVLEFPIMSDYLMTWIDGRKWILTHGHLYNEQIMLPHNPGDVLLHGHTHVKALQKVNDFYFINPGSVSIPKDGPVHSYAVYEDGAFYLKDVESGEVLRSMKLE
ncbi:MAG: phosphodiesterase [Lachnospiraceae bacterium]|nr:phosphodiesterase [Lachnospiraceae bacterium]